MSKYLVIDMETTGLDCYSSSIISCSAVVYEEENCLSGWNGMNCEWKTSDSKISAYALKVNGITLEETSSQLIDSGPSSFISPDMYKFFSFIHRETVTEKHRIRYSFYRQNNTFAYSLADFLIKNAPNCDYLMGMNLQFDLGFLKKLMSTNKIDLEGILPRKQIDPRIIACALEDAGKLPESVKKINSEELYKAYQIESPSGLHKPDTDVFMTHKLWMEMKKDFLNFR